jgi:hypothetical protein
MEIEQPDALIHLAAEATLIAIEVSHQFNSNHQEATS